MAIPLWILFIQGFATGLLTTWLGLVLVNIHPHIRKLAIVGLCYALLAMVIRSLPLHFIFHFGILTFLLIFIVQLMWDLTLLRALIAIVLGNLIMALGESLSLDYFKNLQYRYLYCGNQQLISITSSCTTNHYYCFTYLVIYTEEEKIFI